MPSNSSGSNTLIKARALSFTWPHPCSTFSRARDRSHRTRLRSSAHPEGIVQNPLVEEGNLIATRTAECVNYLVESLGAVGPWEQPAGSYMLPYLDSLEAISVEREAVLLHHCNFGKPFKQPLCSGCLEVSGFHL